MDKANADNPQGKLPLVRLKVHKVTTCFILLLHVVRLYTGIPVYPLLPTCVQWWTAQKAPLYIQMNTYTQDHTWRHMHPRHIHTHH